MPETRWLSHFVAECEAKLNYIANDYIHTNTYYTMDLDIGKYIKQ